MSLITPNWKIKRLGEETKLRAGMSHHIKLFGHARPEIRIVVLLSC